MPWYYSMRNPLARPGISTPNIDMRRAALTLALLLPLALVALGLVAWQRFTGTSYDELVLPGASGLQIERVGWQLTRISYGVPALGANPGTERIAQLTLPSRPSRAAARALQQRLYPRGWVWMEGAERTGPTLFEFGMSRTRYTRSFLFGLATESVLFVGYDGPPAEVRISVVRALHLPRPPAWLRAIFDSR